MLEEGKFLFLARPRRFGKTLLVTTLEAYFPGDQQPTRNFGGHALGMARVDDETLLGGTVLEGHKPSQKLRPVIRLDLFDTHADTPAGLERKLLDLLAHVYQNWYLRGVNVGLDGEALTQPEVFPAGSNTSGPGSRLTFLIKVLFLHYGVEPVVLIDEYDAPIVRLIGRDSIAIGHSTSAAFCEGCLVAGHARRLGIPDYLFPYLGDQVTECRQRNKLAIGKQITVS